MLALHLLSEDRGAKQTDVRSGVLCRQIGRAEVRGIGTAYLVKPKPGQAVSKLPSREEAWPTECRGSFLAFCNHT